MASRQATKRQAALPAGGFRDRLASGGDAQRAIVTGGVTGADLRALRLELELTLRELAHLLGASERSVMRKEQSTAPLGVADADRAYRLARVADAAVELLGDAERAKRWLRAPQRYLGGEAPIVALATEIGTDLVLESLYALAYGGVA